MPDVIHFDRFHKPVPKTHYYDDVSLYRDTFLDDCDIELLFDPAVDGIERDAFIALQLNPVHLHPTEWFLPLSGPRRTGPLTCQPNGRSGRLRPGSDRGFDANRRCVLRIRDGDP
jgi:hypothetical protein